MSDRSVLTPTAQRAPANTRRNAGGNAAITRGRPFAKGNPGRPKGAKNKATRLVEAVANGDVSGILLAAVRRAAQGDVRAQKLCLDRLVPLRRERGVALDLPVLATPGAAAHAATVLVEQVAAGQVTPGEGKKVLEMIVTQRRLVEAGELARRIESLEAVIEVLRQDLACVLGREDLVVRPSAEPSP